jgi:hypothetical protein
VLFSALDARLFRLLSKDFNHDTKRSGGVARTAAGSGMALVSLQED